MDYLSHPDESLDKNYSPLRQKYRKELRRMDEETKKGVVVVEECWKTRELEKNFTALK